MAIMAEDAKLKRGYKQTEVGVIPEEWEVRSLYEGIKLLSGHHVLARHCNTEGKGMPYITGPADFPDGIIKNSKFTEKPTTICRKNDILVTVKGAGAGTIVLADNEYCISRQLMAIRVTEWHTAYVYAFLRKDASLFGAAATGLIPGLSRSDILNKYVPIPPLPEQRAIASALSDVDALITSLDKLIAKKRDIMQATMQQLLTGKVRLPGFSGEWEVKKLGEITESTAGGTPSTLVKEYWGGNIKWMNSGELNAKKVYNVEGRITEEGLKNSSAKIIPSKCVLVGLAGQGKTRGTIAMNMVELCTNQSVAAIFPSQQFIPEYLYYNLDSRYDELRSLSTGEGGRGGLNLSIINSLNIPSPSLSEQQAIAAVLSDMDAEIAALERKREKMYMVKQGMMQELLSGKTRLV